MKSILYITLCITFCMLFTIIGMAHAKADTVSVQQPAKQLIYRHYYHHLSILDSINLATKLLQQKRADSLAMLYLMPNPNRENKFLTEQLRQNVFDLSYIQHLKHKSVQVLKSGQLRTTRSTWIIFAIIALLIYTAILNLVFNSEIRSILHSFYNKQMLNQSEKESYWINPQTFIGMLLLFSFSTGLVIFLITNFNKAYFSVSGIQLFVVASIVVCLLFLIKFLILKLIGYIFEINKLVSQYLAIINLTYFNISFLLLALSICLSLLPAVFIPVLLFITIIIIATVFVWQYLINSVNVISNYQFQKFYLFIYLCALEISPVLILIKALNI